MDQRKAYPTAMALVMARAMRRVAVKYEDFGLARQARALHQKAMLAITNRQSVLGDRDEGEIFSKEKSVKRVTAGPSKIDGGISRVVELSDGSGRIETWAPGKGWVEGEASLDEFIMAAPVSPSLAARMGLPASELGSEACAMQGYHSVKRNPTNGVRSSTDPEMEEMSLAALIRGAQELLAEREQQKKKD